LFLRDEISPARAKQFAESLRANPDVKKVTTISKQQALEEFKQFSGFGHAIDLLEKNPLPTVLEVLPKDALTDKNKLTGLMEQLQKTPEVDFAQLDLAWVERLQSIMATAETAAMILGLLLAATVFFIAGNTIRLEIHNRRQEIVIAKLVGATNGFIQRPFLYTGFWLGFLSAVIAWFIVTISMLVLRQSVENISGLNKGGFHLAFFGYGETFTLISCASLLCVFGSWLVLNIQLKQLNPD
jgi:cell division transport system permease protein